MSRGVRRLAGCLALALVVVACADDAPAPVPSGAATPSPPATSPPSPRPTVTPGATTTVEVFLGNADRGDPCEDVFGVPREVPAADPLSGALEALLAGPTPAEVEAGYGGWFGEATAGLLLGVRVEDGIALVDLDPRLPEVIPNASSSCGSTALLASLDATVLQFPTVEEARYGLGGDRIAFYHWLQRTAPGDRPPPPPSPTPAGPSTPPAPDDDPTAPPDDDHAVGDRGVPANLRGTEWTALPTGERVVALTFDGGANADGAAAILSTLADTATPATFFLTGRFTAVYPQMSATIGSRHPVGNHTMHHPDLTTLSDAEVRDELLAAHDAVVAATGRDPRPWFRFPYGARDDRTIGIVNDLGYGAVRWTTDTLGWKGTSGGGSVDTVVDRVLTGLRPGQVVLLHLGSNPDDGSTLDADALPTIIRRVRAAGYSFVDLDSVLR